MKTIAKHHSYTIEEILAGSNEDDMRRLRDRMILADTIATTLKSRGISQKALAKRLNKKESEVSEWLSGNRNFTIDTLSDIGNALEMIFFDYPSAKRIVSTEPISTKPGKGGKVTFWTRLDHQSVMSAQSVIDNSEVSILAM